MPSVKATTSCWAVCGSRIHRAWLRTRTATSSFTPCAMPCWARWAKATSAGIFPTATRKYRGADSRVFLREVAARMQAAGLRLVNADVTVLAEAPRIAAHRAAMAANLAADLGVPAQLINVKATTTERLGFIGRGEGLAALASVLLGP